MKPVCLVLDHLLHILAAPHMQFLFLGAAYFSFTVQMFHHDHIRMIPERCLNDKVSCFDRNVVVDALGNCPQPRRFTVAVLLRLLDPVDRMLQRVVFFGKL